MTQKTQKQFGLWNSALSPEMLAGETGLADVQWAGDGQTLVWKEDRDDRGVLVVRRPGDAPRTINDRLDVCGNVGYGGGAFAVHDDWVVFAADDGRLYRADLESGLPEPITPEWGQAASPAVSPDGQKVVYVHHAEGEDRLAMVDTDGQSWPGVVAEGADFYMQPAWHPSGDRLVWVRWDHPNMPWNGTFVETAPVTGTGASIVGAIVEVAGDRDVACQQPTYSPDGSKLAYLSDESGHWQLYVRDLDSGDETRISNQGREYGGPAWVQGLRFYGWLPDGESIAAVSVQEGLSRVDRLGVDGQADEMSAFDDYTNLGQIAVSSKGNLAAVASSSSIPPRIATWSRDGGDRVEAYAASERLEKDQLSTVRPVSWSVDDDGPVQTVHGLYYPPTNPKFEGKGDPPAIIMIHGGPTSQRVATWEPRNQFFATRGWAVLDVNYRGSTGYGREYMEALFGNWGIVDVEDAVGGAEFLVDEGLAERDKLVVMGGSAGGYTVLKSLVDHPGAFKAGVAMYGVSNLFDLTRGTHKFEERYCDTLVGELPEAADTYRNRSPLFDADQIEDALALYHGAKDKVVPPEQSEEIAESLRRRNIPHLHHVYDQEGHGWSRGETVAHFHESVLEFLIDNVVYG